MAELSVIVVAASLITGLFVGDGLSRTAVDIADGVTWLTDDPNGEVIQVNPATGQPEVRLKIAGANGHDLGLGQYDNELYVIDNTSGVMTAIDVSTLIRSSQRRVSPGGAAETMTDGETVFLVDRGTSKISAIDPLTGDELGRVWLEDEGLADAAVDDTGTVWSLDTTGELTSLRWSPTSLAFETEDTQRIDDSGPGSVLVGHEEGVTVFGPDSGIVYQVGTGHDVIASSADLLGTITAPRQSQSDLTAAAAPDSSTVVIVANNQVREVDVEGIGCTDPGRPEVFHDRIYVPCMGEGKVILLDANGQPGGPDILTPGSDNPELVLDDDNLLVNAQGSDTGVVVKPDGSIKTIVRNNDAVPTITPQTAAQVQNQTQTVTPASLNTPDPNQPEKGLVPDADAGKDASDPQKPDGAIATDDPSTNENGDKDRGKGKGKVKEPTTVLTPTPTTVPTPTAAPTPTATPTPTAAPTPTPTPTAIPTPTVPTLTPTPTPTPTPAQDPVASTPTGVTATVVSPTQARVDWTYAGDVPDDFVITRVGGGQVATASGPQRQATVIVTPGQASSFVVTANVASDSASSTASNTITTTTPPKASTPTGVSASSISSTQVRVDWAYTGDVPDDFVITRVGGGQVASVGGGQRQGVVTVTPGQASSFVVTANVGASSASSSASNTVTTSGAPGAPTNVAATGTFAGTWKVDKFNVDVSWGAAPDNGSAITGYRVVVTTDYTGGGAGTGGTYNVGPAFRSYRHTESCYTGGDPDAECTSSGNFSVTVTAINAIGQGPATSANGSEPAPPPTLPAGGAQHVTNANHQWDGIAVEGFGHTTLTIAAPADWSSFAGNCSYTFDGSTQAIACGATTLTLQHNGGYRTSQNCPAPVTISHSIRFTAANGVGTVQSAIFNWSYQQPTIGPGCPAP